MVWGNREYHGLEEPDQFWSYRNIDYTGDPIGCWIWLRSKAPPTYHGSLLVNGKQMKAHRYAWQLTNGPIPNGLSVLHRCDNPPCVNPAHLFLGTVGDNNRDKQAKNRSYRPKGVKNPKAKLTPKQVQEIRERYASGTISYELLAREYHVTKPMIGYIIRGENWK